MTLGMELLPDRARALETRAGALELSPSSQQSSAGSRPLVPPSELSGGQKQRVAIARAMASEPKLLLADEPTGALDTQTSNEVMDLIQKINQEGKTILVVTHEEDIAQMCKRIIRLKDGVIVEDTKVNQVLATQYV